ncbi:hypothetical protein I6N96_13675 [Enterococcus sp. BWM-S5]|uniref:Uncharacterized protein n=1 Tax=Enterococcus larvae TaxID=2794352 RepID=A0ABS4CL46_9ENTE|nr:hypothetical protein [Enterococcus larvae]MBP1047328.1 hypothetical protein [Enterococcus larvae]
MDFQYIVHSNKNSGDDEQEYIIFDVLTSATKSVTEKEFEHSIHEETGLTYSGNESTNTIEPLYVENYVD